MRVIKDLETLFRRNSRDAAWTAEIRSADDAARLLVKNNRTTIRVAERYISISIDSFERTSVVAAGYALLEAPAYSRS